MKNLHLKLSMIPGNGGFLSTHGVRWQAYKRTGNPDECWLSERGNGFVEPLRGLRTWRGLVGRKTVGSMYSTKDMAIAAVTKAIVEG